MENKPAPSPALPERVTREEILRQIAAQPDWTPDLLRSAIENEKQMRRILLDYYKSEMRDGEHYYSARGKDQKSLKKEGALNLCSLFKVMPIAVADSIKESWGEDRLSIRMSVELRSLKTGQVMAVGFGACSTGEAKYKNRSHFDLYNTVLKMCEKRAIVDAVTHLPLVSELFTQDMEPADEETVAPSTASNPAPLSRAHARHIQELYERALDLRIWDSREDAQRDFRENYGVASVRDLSKEQAEIHVALLRQLVAAREKRLEGKATREQRQAILDGYRMLIERRVFSSKRDAWGDYLTHGGVDNMLDLPYKHAEEIIKHIQRIETEVLNVVDKFNQI